MSKFENPEKSARDLSCSKADEKLDNLKFERADWTSFRTIEGLQQKAGVAQNALRRLVLKELVDNGLDAGTQVRVGEIGGGYFIEDDGPGIDPDDVARMFSIGRAMVSTKLLRLPTRGALGNGLRVVAGAVLASNGFLAVTTRNCRIELRPERDGSTAVIGRGACARPLGTRVEIGFGPDLPEDKDALNWAHVAIHMAHGTVYPGGSSPWWYDIPNFHELLSACDATPVRALVANLDGCAGGRAGQIVAAAGLGRMLCKDVGRDQAARLLKAARDAVKPVNPKRLGSVGPHAFPALAYAIAHSNAQFGTSEPRADIPFAVEAWAATAEANALVVNVNRTPAAARTSLTRDKTDVNAFGCGLCHTVASAPKGQNFLVLVNVVSPYVPITSDGKEPNLEPFVTTIADAIGKAVRKVRRPGPGTVSQKDVALAHLDEVIDIVSGGERRYRFNERQLFYRMRPIVMAETGNELKVGNFKSIITDYEAEHGEIRLMYREPRGSITHPHSGETITLGTLMVETYERPAWSFNKLLYIEKEGAQEALKQDGWLERHDCAVMSSKGFSTRAARDLIDKLVEHDEPIKVFCAHDADASGTMIYQTLQEATRAREARKIEIINIGLEPWEAAEMGLEVETFDKTDNRKPVADYVALHDGDDVDWDDWLQTHRVELNAMTTPQLIDWLDEKMETYGDGKLIPPQEVLLDELMTVTEKRLRAEITASILSEVGLDDRVAAAMEALSLPDGDDLRRGVAEMFEDNPETDWRAHIEAVVDDLA
jgi:hypothetical protein